MRFCQMLQGKQTRPEQGGGVGFLRQNRCSSQILGSCCAYSGVGGPAQQRAQYAK